MMTSNQLPGVCKALLGMLEHDTDYRLLQSSSIQLFILSHLKETDSKEVPTSSVADLPSTKLLLEPFRRLHGMEYADVVGFVSAQYIYTIECSIYKRTPDVETRILQSAGLKKR